MKIALVAAPLALILAAAIPQGKAQAQYYQGPSVTVPLPGAGIERRGEWDRDHRARCEGLESREHEIRAHLERASFPDERQRLEFRLREAHEDMRRADCR